jgi:hypothetical protein
MTCSQLIERSEILNELRYILLRNETFQIHFCGMLIKTLTCEEITND